jgi:predicted transcriptional regulator
VDGPVVQSSEAIISIRPNFAEAIMSGQKTVELRRKIPSIPVGTRLWIYATRPTAAVVGSAVVEVIDRGTPQAVWDTYSDRIGINRCDFDHYFDGTNEAIGILLRMIKRVQPVHIEQLRVWKEGFHPPQVLSRITAAEAKKLLRMASD